MTAVLSLPPVPVNLAGANVLVHVARLAADEGFIGFDLAGEFLERSTVEGEPNPVHHMPGILLTDTDPARNFPAADSVFAIQNEPHCGKPLVQTERGVFHDRSRFQGELPLIVTRGTLPTAHLGQVANLGASASRTGNPVGPAPRYKVSNAVVRIVEINDCFL
jgi:hypothetical protein